MGSTISRRLSLEPWPWSWAGKASDDRSCHGGIAHRQVIVLVQLGGQRKPEPRGVEVVVGALNQKLPADRSEALGGVYRPAECGNAAEIGIGSALILGRPVAIYPNLGRPVSRRHGGGRKIQNVDAGVARERRGGIDHPEEPAGLEIQVSKLAVLGLARGLAHGIDSLGDLASLLGRGQRLELKRTDVEPGVYAEVIGRDRRGDESGLRRHKGDRPNLYTADDLVFESLIVDLNVVVGGEIALGVVVDVDVYPLPDGAAGSNVYLIVESGWLEAAAAAGVGVLQDGRAAALVSKPVGAKFQSDLAVEGQVGILRREAQHAALPTRGPRAIPDLVPDRLAVQGKVPECGGPLHPGRIERRRDGAVPGHGP